MTPLNPQIRNQAQTYINKPDNNYVPSIQESEYDEVGASLCFVLAFTASVANRQMV